MTRKELKKRLEKEFSKEVVEKILEKSVVIGEDVDKHGNVVKSQADYAWDRLTKESQGSLKGKNQLSYFKDFNGSEGTQLLVDDNITKIFYGEKEVEIKENNKFDGFFPTEYLSNYGLQNLPKINGIKKTLLTTMLYTELVDCERTSKDGYTRKSRTLAYLTDKKLGLAHRFFARELTALFDAVILPSEEKQLEIAIEKLQDKIELNGVDNTYLAINIQPNDNMKNLARCVALIEAYPVVAIYANTLVLNLPIIRDAINNSLDNGNYDVFNKKVNEWNGESYVSTDLGTLISKTISKFDSLKTKRKAFKELLKELKIEELNKEVVAEELEKAKQELEETLEREDVEFNEAKPKKSLIAERVFGIKENETKVEKNNDHDDDEPAGASASVASGESFVDDEEEEDDFPF